MRVLLLVLPAWRAIVAWVVALITPSSLLKEMATLPYRGAGLSVDAKGKLQAHPARSLAEMKRNRARLRQAMQ